MKRGTSVSPSQPNATPTAHRHPAAQGAAQKQPSVTLKHPRCFQPPTAGLWDGRPSLGGVWVAHPDVTDPERVIIRNKANNKFVVGRIVPSRTGHPRATLANLFGCAAEALGMLAGAPAELNVTALRRKKKSPLRAPEAATEAEGVEAPADVTETALDPVATAAAAAIDAAAHTLAAPTPDTAPASNLDKPFIQIGIFSVEGKCQPNSPTDAQRWHGADNQTRREQRQAVLACGCRTGGDKIRAQSAVENHQRAGLFGCLCCDELI